VKALLDRLAALTKDEVGLSATDMMLDLQMTLAKGNAECARTTIARAQACQDERRKRR